MIVLLLPQWLLVAVLLQSPGDVTAQFTEALPTCPGGTFTFRCTVTGNMNGVTIWRVGGDECVLAHSTTGATSACGFTATPGTGFGTSATSFSSTLSGTANITLNGTLVECFGPGLARDAGNMVGNSTLQILGPPSIPTLSCVDLSEDVSGAVNVTVSWTLSDGDSADFYLINITRNPPDGRLVNITTASVTQYELTGFIAGYEYNITVRGVTSNCGGLVGRESEPLTIRPQVPDIPNISVCAVYDMMNETLQIIESTWNEVDNVTVSEDCPNGRDITATYELTYTTESGTPIATCVLNGTECSSGTCRRELQNNTADSRCQPPVSQFSGEGVTVSVTARNIVGSSSPAVSRNISGTNVYLNVSVNATDSTNTSVECMFIEPAYNCSIDYGTNSSYTNPVYMNTSFTMEQTATITLSQELIENTAYYYTVSAESASQCVRVRGRFRTTGCSVTELSITTPQDETGRCAADGFVSGSFISGGVVCYNGTTAGSRAVYTCTAGYDLVGNEARVCQSDGNWNGSIPECIQQGSECNVTDLGITTRTEMVDTRCTNRGFVNSSSITDGVVCYSGTTVGSTAVYICSDDNVTVGVIRTCQDNGTWSGGISSCSAALGILRVVMLVIGVPLAAVSAVTITFETGNSIIISFKDKMMRWLIIAIATIFCVIGLAFWIAALVLLFNEQTVTTVTTVCIVLGLTGIVVAFIFIAAAVWIRIYNNRKKIQKDEKKKRWLIIALLVIAAILCLIGIGLWIALAVLVYSGRGGDETDGPSEKSKKTRRPAPEGSEEKVEMKDPKLKKEEDEPQYSTTQHFSTSPVPLLSTNPEYSQLGEHGETGGGDIYNKPVHGGHPHAVPNPADPNYSHFKEGEATGEGYNRVQRGPPPRAVPNPRDPSYSHFPEGASRPPAEALQYDVVGTDPRYKPKPKEEEEAKGKKKGRK